jgi:hypothetical protein
LLDWKEICVRIWLILIAELPCIVSLRPAIAWHADGHIKATALAVDGVRDAMPAFFVQGEELVCHCSVDPDLFKLEVDSYALYQAESPEHYLDLEYVADMDLPEGRQSFISRCLSRGLWFAKVGTLPYAASEWTYRLAIALAEHRRWPEDRSIQTKCLVYAGILAHYAQDMVMPLHCTIHYDGLAGPDGTRPHTGIHAMVDALIGKVDTGEISLLDSNDHLTFDNVFQA